MQIPKDDSFDFLASSDQSSMPRSRSAHALPANNGQGLDASQRSEGLNGYPAAPAAAGVLDMDAPREEFPFLLAEHAFDATSLEALQMESDPTARCLSFNKYDLAFVHYAHSSGWTDVTLVRNQERGWVPIDFFTGYSDPRAIPLLAAVAAFLTNPKSQKVVKFRTASGSTHKGSTPIGGQQRFISGYTFSEPAINEMINGTKLLLDKASVLSRDSVLVQQFPYVASARKALLTELAHIVRKAQVHKNSTDNAVIDKLVRSCYRLLKQTQELLKNIDQPEVRHFVGAMRRKESRSSRRSSTRSSGTSSTSSIRSGYASSNLGGPGSTTLLKTSQVSPDSSTQSDHTEASVVSNGSGSLLGAEIYRIRSFRDHSATPKPLDRLQEVMDAFIFYLNQFVNSEEGLLKDTKDPDTSPAILALTRHSMLACRELLPVLDLCPAANINEPRDELLEEIRKLVSSARSVASSLPPSPANMLAVAAQSMSVSASRCVQVSLLSARECYAFLLDNPGLELASDWSYPVFTTNETHEHVDLTGDQATIKTEAQNTSNGSRKRSRERPLSQISPRSSFVHESHQEADSSFTSTTSEKFRAEPVSAGSTEYEPMAVEEATPHSDALVMLNGKVRGGSLTAIVEWLTGPDYGKLEMEIRIFLLCFRLFATAKDLVIELGSLPQSAGVTHMANLWAQSFWDASDKVLQSLQPILDQRIYNARQLLMKSSRSSRTGQLLDVPLNPDPKSYLSKSAIPSTSRNASTTSLPNIRQNSIGQPFSSSSAMNLAQSFREFSLGGRRMSRQPSTDDSRGHFNGSSNGGSSGVSVGTLTDGSELATFLMERNSSDISQQLTLMWSGILRQIRASELLDQRFSASKRHLGLAPHVVQFIQSSNHLSSLVSDTILAPELSNKQRMRVLKQWIKIADDMYTLGNLNGVVSIIAVLQSTSISRLHKAWESLASKHQVTLDRLVPLASPNRNFSQYRQDLQRRYGTPCVPYMGCLLNDLIFTEEGNTKLLKPSGAINFDRYWRIGKLIAAFQPFQQESYEIQPDMGLQSWLRSQMAYSHSRESQDTDGLWRRSLLIQPERD